MAVSCQVGKVCFCYLNFLQEVTKYQRTVANVFEDCSEDLQLVERLSVAHTHFLELLEGKENPPSQASWLPFCTVPQAEKSEIWGHFHQRALLPAPRTGSQQSSGVSRGPPGPLQPEFDFLPTHGFWSFSFSCIHSLASYIQGFALCKVFLFHQSSWPKMSPRSAHLTCRRYSLLWQSPSTTRHDSQAWGTSAALHRHVSTL